MPGRLPRLSTLNTARTDEAPQPRLKPHGLPPALEPHGVNLAMPLTVDDIAAAVEVSVRTIESHFMEDLDQTPTAYVRNRRPECVRADLADARPGSGATVTDIALRWGFTHLGRFATTYRSRYGESPSQMLRS